MPLLPVRPGRLRPKRLIQGSLLDLNPFPGYSKPILSCFAPAGEFECRLPARPDRAAVAGLHSSGPDYRDVGGAEADAVLAFLVTRHHPRHGIEYWRPEPEPGWHDLLALTKRGEASLEGDLHPFMAHLQYFKDLLALPRPGLPGPVS